MRIGAHMSAAGGVTRAVDRAVLHGCECLQLFTKNNARWQGKPIAPLDAIAFRRAVERAGLRPVAAHASYLINLAAPPGPLRDRSIDALVDELERATQLGLDGVVIHPGVAAAGMSDEHALSLAAEAVRAAFARTSDEGPLLLLEHTAGQGRSIGHRFEHLAALLDLLEHSPRAGICLDTCHLLAAGYDISTKQGYETTIAEFDRIVGITRLRLIHANDSRRPAGSRVDRHEHVGKGFVGAAAFRRLAHDPRLAALAMVIETAKTPGVCDNPTRVLLDPLDVMNLDALRTLRGTRRLAALNLYRAPST